MIVIQKVFKLQNQNIYASHNELSTLLLPITFTTFTLKLVTCLTLWFDMDESPIAQVRQMEANPIVPPTPDVAHQHVAAAQPVIGVVSPLPVISAADTTHSRQWPLIILDNDDDNREIEIITID